MIHFLEEDDEFYRFSPKFVRSELDEYIENYFQLKKLKNITKDQDEMMKFYFSFVSEVEIKDRTSIYTYKKCFLGIFIYSSRK